MTKPWDPFDRPQPLVSCLTHEALLVQAWKKAHAYIRTRNWYADVLELDLSAANLKAEIAEWRSLCAEAGGLVPTPRPMRLVPAPKTCTWEYRLDRATGEVRWQPRLKRNTETGKRELGCLRPLAHLSIRDQAFATAAMICLADLVETAQGNCDLKTPEAKLKGVSSYGNRLFCEWTAGHDQARFGWGNANSYRKYYTDYRAFLRRPREICDEAEPFLESGEELGVVSLDLAGFYDRIPPGEIIAALKRLCKNQGLRSDPGFWQSLKRIFSWRWAKDSVPVDVLLRDGERPNGLPQGLVASGFFSNAYMIAFDEAVRKAIQATTSQRDFAVLDYCRYVDDMRVVVRWTPSRASKDQPEEQLKMQVTEWICGILSEYAKGQECNSDKTEYTPYRELRSKSSRAATMEVIQHHLSGPVDSEVMEEVLIALDGLLGSVENPSDALRRRVPEGSPALARVFETSTEVRDDTLKRFATNRQLKFLRDRREQAAQDSSEEGRQECQRYDADIDVAARRMIHLWAGDPSLGLVLRNAMNLMPAPHLLEPVLEQLRHWIGLTPASEEDVLPRWVCLYATADLLKAGVIETGLNVAKDALPEKSDLHGYREMLAEFAEWLLSPGDGIDVPWYVRQQSIMFLVSIGRPVSSDDSMKGPALHDYIGLLSVAQGQLGQISNPQKRLAPLMIVADQFRPDHQRTVSRLARWLAAHDADEAAGVADQVYLADSSLFEQLLDYTEGKQQHIAWRERIDRCYGRALRLRNLPVASVEQRKVPLTTVAATTDNPFRHENAALQFLLSLIDALRAKNKEFTCLPPQAVAMKCREWIRLKNPKWPHDAVHLTVFLPAQDGEDPRYLLPDWCPAQRRTFMTIGRLLRAAMTGDPDYSAPFSFATRLREGYRGIRSSWYKREHGMFHRPDALGGQGASCSPWITELLAKLLLWPGCRETTRLIPNWNQVRTLGDLTALVLRRLKDQASVFAASCDLPVYIHPVGLQLKNKPVLTAVLIQTVRPWRSDFVTQGVMLDGAGFQPLRRGHLASLLRVAEKMLSLRDTYGKKVEADLVLLPELSVHEQDLDIIERLVDRTGAMVFCGLVFRHVTGIAGLVNTARWIIPDRQETGRSLIHIDQGKHHLTDIETGLGIQSWRPHQVVIELQNGLSGRPYRITGAICFDATDLKLAADLRDITDMFVIPANNKDVGTFDAMAGTLSYHMYQHVLIVNTGEFGGTTVMAPYQERHERVLTHHHGGGHAAVSIVDVDLSDYQHVTRPPSRPLKTAPAGYSRHDRNGEGV